MSARARGFESHPLRWRTLSDRIPYVSVIVIYEYMYLAMSGDVPKMAEGTPLERVQVVNSGARVQIPPSPFEVIGLADDLK